MRRVLGMLEDLAENHKEIRDVMAGVREGIKEGIGEDYANRERIAKLLRFSSTLTDSERKEVSFADYASA